MQPHGAVQDVRRRHFQDRPGGYINCLDSGGFGGVTITKSLSIVCEGVIADGALTFIRVGGSNISFNGTGADGSLGGTVLSYKDNRINGNASDGTAVPAVGLE